MEKEKCCCEHKCGCRRDVCNDAICGMPEFLSIYAPVVYDEVGVNVCREVTVPADVLANFPTTECVSVDVINIDLAGTDDAVSTIDDSLRPNCFKITLTNILVTLKIKLYDKCHKYLGSTTITVNYLPGSTTSTDYDYYSEKTNPSNVTFELFAPYGVGINEGGDYYFNIVGMYENNNTVVNGVNLSGTAKAMNFDEVTGVFSAGLSLFVRTLYYEVYEIPYIGKSKPVKVNLRDNSENACIKFVESGLLSKEIKPLELAPPKCEGRLKKEKEKCCYNDCKLQIKNPCDEKRPKEDFVDEEDEKD